MPDQLGLVVGDSQASNLHIGEDGKPEADLEHVDYYVRPT